MSDMMDLIAQRAAKTATVSPDDYRGEDGLLYCGKCRTRKEWRNPADGRLLRSECRCSQEAQEKKDAERRRDEWFEAACALPIYALHDRHIAGDTFDRHDGSNRKAREIAEQYVSRWDEIRKNGGGLLFWGDVGTGKSFTAGCIVNALAARKVPVLMTSSTRLLNAVSDLGSDKNGIVDSLRYFDLLVLDDFGAERQTPYVLEQLTSIIDDRTRSGLPLVVSTNLTVNQLKNPENMELCRIYDRVTGCCVPVHFTGESHRAEKARERMNWLKGVLGCDQPQLRENEKSRPQCDSTEGGKGGESATRSASSLPEIEEERKA